MPVVNLKLSIHGFYPPYKGGALVTRIGSFLFNALGIQLRLLLIMAQKSTLPVLEMWQSLQILQTIQYNKWMVSSLPQMVFQLEEIGLN